MSKLDGLRVLLVGCPGELTQSLLAGGHQIKVPDKPTCVLCANRFPPWDVVILDLQEQGSDPFDLARDICTAAPYRKPMLLALAETDTVEQDQRCRRAGIDLLFVKPVQPDLLLGFLGRLQAVRRDIESFDPMI